MAKDKSLIYGSSENLKCKNPMEKRKLEENKKLLSVLAWTVRWILWFGVQIHSKGEIKRISQITMKKVSVDSGQKFIIYRNQIFRLLCFPKPVFDLLAIELPCLMGFRPGEIVTWLAEYIDFQNMNTKVYDSKKKKLFTVPLNHYVAVHTEELLNGRSTGHVLLSRSTRNKGDSLTPFAVWHIWNKYTTLLKLPNAKEISPVTGRRFFACEWYYKQDLSLVTLQMILRHTHFETTMRYVRSLVFYEDLKTDYDSFQFRIIREIEKQPEVVI